MSVRTRLTVLVVLAMCPVGAVAGDTIPSIVVQEYFEELEAALRRLAGTRTVAKVELSPTDRLFVDFLTRHAGVYTMLRTNSKGVVINEAIRGRRPRRVYRSVARQRWYVTLHSSWEEHRGKVVDRYGKTWLLWAQPIIIARGSGPKRFGGVVVAKIDLMECLKQVATDSEYPFQVVVDGTRFFSHRWDNSRETVYFPIVIPGTDSASVLEVSLAAEPSVAPSTDFIDLGVDEAVGQEQDAVAVEEERVRGWEPPVWRILFCGLLAWALTALIRRRVRRHRILRKVFQEEPT